MKTANEQNSSKSMQKPTTKQLTIKQLTIFISLVLLATIPLISIFKYSWYPMHDSTQISRLFLMKQTIQRGQIPPIWSFDTNNGYGYPLFHFYAPLTYYVSLIFNTITNSYTISLKLTIYAFTVIGAIGIFLLVKQVDIYGAILSSASFLLLPYMALNLYVRGAFAEYVGTMLIPLLFYVWKAQQTGKQPYVTAIVTTLFILSHNLIPIIVLPFLVIWILFHHSNKKELISLIKPSILSVSLSSFFIIPLMLERSFVQVDNIARTTNFRIHFIKLWQIWNSTWGFGGSAEGVLDGMSFKIGKVQTLLSIIGLASLILSRTKRNIKLALMVITPSILFSIFMTNEFSLWLWNITKYIQMIQFPWRYLTVLGFFISLASGYTFIAIPERLRILKLPALATLTLILIFFNLKYFKPQYEISNAEKIYTSKEYIKNDLAKVIPEYIPVWMSGFPTSHATDYAFDENQNSYIIQSNSIATSTTSREVVIEKAYYPTWKAWVDGTPTQIKPSSDGMIVISVPREFKYIKLTQSHTKTEMISLYISIATLLYITYSLIRYGLISRATHKQRTI